MQELAQLIDALPADLARRAFTHASWSERRADSFRRLAFLGDSVLSLAMTQELHARLDPDRCAVGLLTKVRSRAVSRPSCAAVARRLDLARRLMATVPEDARLASEALVSTESVLAECMEAAIGACHLHFGFDRTATALVATFAPEIDAAIEQPTDFKSRLQERLARRAQVVVYAVVERDGPPHQPTFEVSATVAGEELARGRGRSKKDAEQAAARAALDALER